ncbi:MAG: hypothetical protein AABY32_00600 [Nanoarchaeota archaeon]
MDDQEYWENVMNDTENHDWASVLISEFHELVTMYTFYEILKDKPKEEKEFIFNELMGEWKNHVKSVIEDNIKKHTEMCQTPLGRRMAEKVCDGEQIRIMYHKAFKTAEKEIKEQFNSIEENNV